MTRVLTMSPPPDLGDTVTLDDGRPALVLHRLPKVRGRLPAVRVNDSPRCPDCDGRLLWTAPGAWTCDDCGDVPAPPPPPPALAAIRRRGERRDANRRTAANRQRQIERGAAGGAVLLVRAAEAIDHGAESAAWRRRLLESAPGPERRAIRYALGPNARRAELTTEACRRAAAKLCQPSETGPASAPILLPGVPGRPRNSETTVRGRHERHHGGTLPKVTHSQRLPLLAAIGAPGRPGRLRLVRPDLRSGRGPGRPPPRRRRRREPDDPDTTGDLFESVPEAEA